MINALLDGSSMLPTILMIVGGALAFLALLYGFIKKFSRMSWLCWQVAAIFAATLLLKFVPETVTGITMFAVGAGGILAAIVIVFMFGALLRKPFLAMESGGGFARFFNRFLGAVTAILNFAVLALVFGGFALVMMQPFANTITALDVVYNNALWTGFFGAHALDLFLVFWLACIARCGYRVGFLRLIITILMLLITAAAFFGAILLTLNLGFLMSFSNTVAGWFPASMNPHVASVIGFAIVVLLVFLVLLIAVVLIGLLLNLILRQAQKSRIFRGIDGAIFGTLLFVLTIAFFCAFDFGIYTLVEMCADGSLQSSITDLVSQFGVEGMGESVSSAIEGIADFIQPFADVFRSSPLSKIFFDYNPLRMLA